MLRNGDFGAFKVHLSALSMTSSQPTSSKHVNTAEPRPRGHAARAGTRGSAAHMYTCPLDFLERGVKAVPGAAHVLLVSEGLMAALREGRCKIVWAVPQEGRAVPGNELNRTGKVVIWVWRHQTGWMSPPPDTQMSYPMSQPVTQQRRLLNQSHTCK